MFVVVMVVIVMVVMVVIVVMAVVVVTMVMVCMLLLPPSSPSSCQVSGLSTDPTAITYRTRLCEGFQKKLIPKAYLK